MNLSWSTTTYDLNGRPTQTMGFDGSVTFTVYDPADGQVGATIVDRNGDGVYTAGVDSKTTYTLVNGVSLPDPLTGYNSKYFGTQTTTYSGSGTTANLVASANLGLDQLTITSAPVNADGSVSWAQGFATYSDSDIQGGGAALTLTLNPDQTLITDTYSGELVQSEQQSRKNQQAVSTTIFGYDALDRINGVGDGVFQPTSATYNADGSTATLTLPGEPAITVNQIDPSTGLPSQVTRADGGRDATAYNALGQVQSQSGAGTTAASFEYDPATGELSNLDVLPSGSVGDATGSESTGWQYDPTTGALKNKTYADGSNDVYNYNDKTQLSTATLRGGIAAQFGYDTAGDQTGATYADTHTDASIADSSGTLDDQGRPHVLTEVSKDAAGNVTAASADILGYTSVGQLSDAYQSAAGGITVHCDYYGPTDTGVGQEPGAIKDVVLIGIGGQPIANTETDYTYDPAGRLWQISVGGVTYTYSYKPDTNLVSSIAGEVDPIAYGYDVATGQLSSITAMATSATDPGVQTAYSASYVYNNNQQRSADLVSQTNADGSTTSSDYGYAYDGQDQLQSVTDLNTKGQLYGYAYDGVGNRTDLGSVNAMNEHAALVYDSRGDVINDGTFVYTWDAKGRLVSVTPNNPASGSQKDVFSYDEQDRRTEKDAYAWSGSAWVLTSELKFVYDDSQIIAELDGTNRLLQAYTWGSNGTLLSITDFTTGYPHVYQVVTDATGNVVQLDDASSGAVVASYRYDPWGNPITPDTPAAEGQTNLCPFRWQGEFYDAAFGGYDMGAREGAATLHMFLSPDPSGEASDVNLYRLDGNDPVNNVDPTGLAPVPSTQPATSTYSTLLANMSSGASTALTEAVVAAPNGRLTRAQAFSIPLTSADAMIFLHAAGKDRLAVTPGMLRNAAEDTGFFQTMFGDGGYAYDSYTTALKNNPALGMTRDQYYQSLASAHNIAMARDVMQMQGNMMAYLYARLAVPTANLINLAVMAPAAIPSGGSFYSPGFGPSSTRIIGNTALPKTNVALGLEKIGHQASLEPFAESFGGVTAREWATKLMASAPEGRFDIAFAQALDNAIASGGRIKFNLNSLDVPKALAGDATMRVGRFTEWELQQIVSKPRWIGKTDFYLNERELTDAELQALGIKK